jgi:type IV pilus assembly protein PilA
MVVTLIIGILVAFALPTFLGARERAYDRAAQASLRVGWTAARVCATDDGDFADCDADMLRTIDTSIRFVDVPGTSTGADTVSLSTSDQVWSGAVLSRSGTCWMIRDDLASQLLYGEVTIPICDGTEALASAALSW